MSKLNVSVPHTLDEENKEDCVSIAISLLTRQKKKTFSQKFHYKWRKTCLFWQYSTQKAIAWLKGVGGFMKVMLRIWWDNHSIIHFNFLNCNQTPNADLYSQQLPRVQENLRKRPTLVIVLLDNARPHARRISQEKNWIQADLFYLIHYIHQTLRQVNSIFFVLNKMFWMTRNFSHENPVKMLIENFLSSKPVERNQQVNWLTARDHWK